MNDVEKALHIAKKAHAGQTDKAECEYINHLIHVADSLNTEEEKIVAYLHDVVEDTSITIENLANEGFSETIIQAIDTITKKKNESYEEYVQKIAENPLARKVKIADLKHNSDLTRLKKITEKDIARVEKYQKCLNYLLEVDKHHHQNNCLFCHFKH